MDNNTGITVAVIGTGLRGFDYSEYLLKNPHAGTIVAAVDPNPERLHSFSTKHSIPEDKRFDTFVSFFEKPKMCDAVLICTQDRMHYLPTMRALEMGYHVFVEKPMSHDLREVLAMAQKADQAGRVLMVGHVLRYTPFFEKMKAILNNGSIGKIVSIDLIENVSHLLYTHSFVRGNWNNSESSNFMLLAKSCHDIDILHWLINKSCERVSSFGTLSYFTASNAPEGSTERCTDGCKVERTCPFSAIRTYVENNDYPYTYHQANIVDSIRKEDKLKAIKEGPYGRCVYHCDNNVVDHQVVSMEFEEGITANFSMVGLSQDQGRTIKIFGTAGQIRGHSEKNEIEILRYNGESEIVRPRISSSAHGGGDDLLVEDFLLQVKSGNTRGGRTTAATSANSHITTFAAEEARLCRKVVEIKDFIQQFT